MQLRVTQDGASGRPVKLGPPRGHPRPLRRPLETRPADTRSRARQICGRCCPDKPGPLPATRTHARTLARTHARTHPHATLPRQDRDGTEARRSPVAAGRSGAHVWLRSAGSNSTRQGLDTTISWGTPPSPPQPRSPSSRPSQRPPRSLSLASAGAWQCSSLARASQPPHPGVSKPSAGRRPPASHAWLRRRPAEAGRPAARPAAGADSRPAARSAVQRRRRRGRHGRRGGCQRGGGAARG